MYEVIAPPGLLLIEPFEKKNSSIIIVKEKDEAPTQGTIIDTGSGVDKDWLGLDVIFKKYSTTSFSFNEKKYISIPVDEVIAIVAPTQ